MKTKYGLPRQVNPDSSLGFYRCFQGYSQRRLADECSVPLRFIQKLESGNYHVAACYIQPVADYIGISMDALVRNNLAEIIPLLVAPPVDPQAKENFLRKQERAIDIGKKGEDIVVARERKKLEGTPFVKAVNPNPSNDPNRGFDVLSFTMDCQPLYIEVKTTPQDCDEDFFISAKELEHMQECMDNGRNYELHRVYYVDDDAARGVEVYTPETLLEEFEFIPCNYIVRRKGGDRA